MKKSSRSNAAASFPIEVQAKAGRPLGMTSAQFLANYWQKRPLLIRNAFADFKSPITPNELAGLACEPLALSRLITHSPRSDRWKVESGPFAETRFSRVPKTHWTLLVQDVDKWDPGVAALFDTVDFLPSWRLDDVMISYAVEGGSVGAHVDQYDVFLLQGLGQRHWQIDAGANPPQTYRDDVDLKLLKDFHPSHDWILQPGDMLYLPPGVPHLGIALDDCMTISLGMRAPSVADLILDLAESTVAELPESTRYSDPDLQPRSDPHLIEASDLLRLKQALSHLRDLSDADLAHWFGGFLSRYRNAQSPAPAPKVLSEQALIKQLQSGKRLLWHPFARRAARVEKRGIHLYVAGDAYLISRSCYRTLMDAHAWNTQAWQSFSETDRSQVMAMFQAGQLVLGR